MGTPFRVSPASEQVAVILTRADFKVFLDELHEAMKARTPRYDDDVCDPGYWVVEALKQANLLTREPYKTWYEEWRNK